jgi:hypothetical protein
MQGREMVSATPALAAPPPAEAVVPAPRPARAKRVSKKQSEEAPAPDPAADGKPEQADSPDEALALPAAKRQKKSKAGAGGAACGESAQPITVGSKAASSKGGRVEMSFKEWVEGAIDSWSKAEGQSVSAAGKNEFVAYMYNELNKGCERAKKNNRKIAQSFDFGF